MKFFYLYLIAILTITNDRLNQFVSFVYAYSQQYIFSLSIVPKLNKFNGDLGRNFGVKKKKMRKNLSFTPLLFIKFNLS